jgi:hypothetical protein
VTQKNKTFGRYDNGFTLTFENGLVLSTCFGAMNYCENRGGRTSIRGRRAFRGRMRGAFSSMFSDNAEVSVWLNNAESNGSHDWVNGWQEVVFGDADPADDVRGWVAMAEWLQIVDWCRTWKPE